MEMKDTGIGTQADLDADLADKSFNDAGSLGNSFVQPQLRQHQQIQYQDSLLRHTETEPIYGEVDLAYFKEVQAGQENNPNRRIPVL